MAFVDWYPGYTVNNDQMDRDHQALFRAINDLREGTLEGRPEESLQKSFHFLRNYVITHLEAEEKMLLEIGYPEFPEHKAAHEQLLHQMRIHEKLFNEGKKREAADLLSFLLKTWLVSHILGMDRAYGKYLALHRIGFSETEASL